MTTVHDLLAAYVTGTGLSVSMSYARQMFLTELVQRGIEPSDITDLCKEMKKLISQDRKGTYTYACLDFRNLMEPDKCEERCLALRQRKARSRPIPAQTNHVVDDGQGKIVRLADVQPPEPSRIDVVNGLRGLASELERKKV